MATAKVTTDIISKYSPKQRSQILFPPQGRTHQEEAAACDINNIVRQYLKTGTVSHLAKREGFYADLSGIDFKEAITLVEEAKSSFDSLPSAIRKRFNNSPVDFVEFIADPANKQVAQKMGLIPAPAEAVAPPKQNPGPVVPGTP